MDLSYEQVIKYSFYIVIILYIVMNVFIIDIFP